MGKPNQHKKNNRKGGYKSSKGKKGKFQKGSKKIFGEKPPKPTKQQMKNSAVDKQMKNPEAGMRLNKYIANSGECSRRDADIYIASGNVQVNGEVITQMGYKVKLTDEVKFDGRRINPEPKEYILLNKPSGYYVTGSLEQNSRTVMDLVARATKNVVTPVGSFETSSKGLLLFTNDGTLEKKLAKKGIRQIFHVELRRKFAVEELNILREGIRLQEGLIKPVEVDFVVGKSHHHVGIELTSTLPQIVQKLFAKLNHQIINLDRVVYGGLTKKNLPRGHYRYLSKQEIINLGIM